MVNYLILLLTCCLLTSCQDAWKLLDITKDSSGGQTQDDLRVLTDQWSCCGRISKDGKYAFFLSTGALAPDHLDGSYQLYRLNLNDNSLDLVSRNQLGDIASAANNAGADHYAISANGEQIAVKTFSDNFHPDLVGNTTRHIVHKNLLTNVVSMVSTSSLGNLGNSPHHNQPMMSDDGRYVGFSGSSTNLGVTGVGGIFRKDILTDTTIDASSDIFDVGGAGSLDNDISPDGTRSVFITWQNPWGLAPSAGYFGVYLKNHTNGVLELVSLDDMGNPVDIGNHYFVTQVLADNVTVAFSTIDTVMSAYPSNTFRQAYLRNTQTNAYTIITTNENGDMADANATVEDITDDGRYALIGTNASNMIVGQVMTNLHRFYRKDLLTGKVVLVSADSDGVANSQEPAFGNRAQAISADGKKVIFQTDEDFFGLGDGVPRVYVKELP